MTRILVLTIWFVSNDTNKCIIEYQDICINDRIQFYIVLDPCVMKEKRMNKKLNLLILSSDIIKGCRNTVVAGGTTSMWN